MTVGDILTRGDDAVHVCGTCLSHDGIGLGLIPAAESIPRARTSLDGQIHCKTALLHLRRLHPGVQLTLTATVCCATTTLPPLTARSVCTHARQAPFFYRAMLCIRGTSRGSVSVCVRVRLSQVGVLSKRLNESSWFLTRELPSTRPTVR